MSDIVAKNASYEKNVKQGAKLKKLIEKQKNKTLKERDRSAYGRVEDRIAKVKADKDRLSNDDENQLDISGTSSQILMMQMRGNYKFKE